MSSVPVISLAQDRTAAAREIYGALTTTGFLVAVDHGVKPRLLADLHEITQEFMAQPAAVKRRSSADPPNRYCGYTSPDDEGQESQLEKYEVCTFDTVADMAAAGYTPRWTSLLMPNLWPDLPHFQSIWRAWMAESKRVGQDLFRLIAAGLGIPEAWFSGKCEGACDFWVANHYFPPAEGDGDGDRLAAHTDIEALTVLYRPGKQDPNGLQVQTVDGAWESVPVVDWSFVINLGSMLAEWTSRELRATPHRVRQGGERWSYPAFQGPRKDVLLAPVPGRENRHEPVAAGDWTAERMARLDRAGVLA